MKKRYANSAMLPLVLLAVIFSLIILVSYALLQRRGSTPATAPVSGVSSVDGLPLSSQADARVLSPPAGSGRPAGWMDGGIFSDSYDRAFAKLSEMTIEEKAGQVFLARCPPQWNALKAVADMQPGGFVLFGGDFAGKTRGQVAQTLASYQASSRIPMLLAVDEEGGGVVRISSNPALAEAPFRSPMSIYDEGGLEAIRADAANKAEFLTGLGLNLNLAPVCDVSTDKRDYIYGRTLGKGAAEVSAYVSAVVETAETNGLSSALKHFPGYGNNADTHTGISVDKRDMDSFESSDLLPFQAGIDAGAEAVLVSHNIVACMDAERPASLSPAVHALLREKLDFTGLALTDDLAMDAIEEYTKGQNPAVAALLAGNDLLITSDLARGVTALLEAVEDGSLPKGTLDHAVFRILAMKYHTGLL